MLSPRRILTAVGAALILFILYHTITTPSAGSVKQRDGTWTRGYPPSGRRGASHQKVIQDMASRPLRERLKYYFPYDIESKFPAAIWQTWKASPSSGEFNSELRALEASWTEKHPGFVHEVIVDDAAEHLIRYLYASVPEVANAYLAMPLPVLKADFFRYLILLARGGIYSDIDTKALKSAADWLPSDLESSSIGLVVGIEADPDREDWHDWYARRIQFCQWTIQSKPGHPVLRDLVATITELTLEMQKQGHLRKGHLPTAKSVMEFTGPGIWTDAVFSYFNNREFWKTNGISSNTSVNHFFNLRTYKRVGDIMVLPITSFSPGVGQMGAEDTENEMAFVHHEFHGSWKPEDEKGDKKADEAPSEES